MIEKEKYVTKQSFECLSSCWTGYLNYWNYEVDACDLFFGGGGYHLTLDTNYGQFRTNLFHSSFEFANQNKLSYEKKNVSIFKNKEQFLLECLRDNRYVSIKVESRFLDYSAALRQTEDVPHCINPLEIDSINRKIYIADGDIPTLSPSVFEGWVGLDMVLNAWKMQGYEYFILNKTRRISIDKVMNDTLYGAIEAIAEYIEGGTDMYGRAYGCKAIKDAFLLISHLYDKSDLENFNTVVRNFNFQMKTGGFIAEKYFLLQLIERITLSPDLVDRFRSSIYDWNNCCLLLIKLGMTKKRAFLTRILEKVNHVLMNEIECLKDILLEIESMVNV